MKDGKLVVNVEEGRIVSVAVGSGLYESYRRLFTDAETDLRKTGSSVDVAVRVVVFGSMWIEALCNEYIPTLLEQSDLPRLVARALWSGLKRAPTMQKLKIVAAFDTRGDANPDWLNPLGQLFSLRNSLVHFKDVETEVSRAVTIEELGATLSRLPEAELTVRMKDTASENAALVNAAVKRMDRILDQHVRRETTTLSDRTAGSE